MLAWIVAVHGEGTTEAIVILFYPVCKPTTIQREDIDMFHLDPYKGYHEQVGHVKHGLFRINWHTQCTAEHKSNILKRM